MSKHLPVDRLLDIAAEREQPTADETAHLDCCACCSDDLAMERTICCIVDDSDVPAPPLPADFTARTRDAWRNAKVSKRRRETLFGFALATATLLSAAGGLIWLLAPDAALIAGQFISVLANVLVVMKALAVVGTQLPFITGVVAAAMCATLVVISTLLTRLSHSGGVIRLR